MIYIFYNNFFKLFIIKKIIMKRINLNYINTISKTINIMHKIFDKDYERLQDFQRLYKKGEDIYSRKVLYLYYDIMNKFIYNHKTQKFIYFGYLGYLGYMHNDYVNKVHKPFENYVIKQKIMKESDIHFLVDMYNRNYEPKPIENYVIKEKFIEESNIQFLLELNIFKKTGDNPLDKYLNYDELKFHNLNQIQNITFGYYHHVHFIELLKYHDIHYIKSP